MDIAIYKQTLDEIDDLEKCIEKLSSTCYNTPPIKFKSKKYYDSLFTSLNNLVQDYYNDLDDYEHSKKNKPRVSSAHYKKHREMIRFLKDIDHNCFHPHPNYVPEKTKSYNIPKNVIAECYKNYRFNENIYTGKPGICYMFDLDQVRFKLDSFIELLSTCRDGFSCYEEIVQSFDEILKWINTYANYRDYPEWIDIIEHAEMIEDSIKDLFWCNNKKHLNKIKKDVLIFSESLCGLIYEFRIGIP